MFPIQHMKTCTGEGAKREVPVVIDRHLPEKTQGKRPSQSYISEKRTPSQDERPSQSGRGGVLGRSLQISDDIEVQKIKEYKVGSLFF